MAATETLSALTGRYLLNNGTTTTGAIRTINQSLGSLNMSAWDADKALNIINAISPVVDKEIVQAQAVKTYDLENE